MKADKEVGGRSKRRNAGERANDKLKKKTDTEQPNEGKEEGDTGYGGPEKGYNVIVVYPRAEIFSSSLGNEREVSMTCLRPGHPPYSS